MSDRPIGILLVLWLLASRRSDKKKHGHSGRQNPLDRYVAEVGGAFGGSAGGHARLRLAGRLAPGGRGPRCAGQPGGRCAHYRGGGTGFGGSHRRHQDVTRASSTANSVTAAGGRQERHRSLANLAGIVGRHRTERAGHHQPHHHPDPPPSRRA